MAPNTANNKIAPTKKKKKFQARMKRRKKKKNDDGRSMHLSVLIKKTCLITCKGKIIALAKKSYSSNIATNV